MVYNTHVMCPAETGVSDRDIEKLENLLGKQWVQSQLAEYESFRKEYSPVDLWSHRHATTPPIIPLLFQYHHPEYDRKQMTPFGHWYGDPLHSLEQIASDIYSFEGYWSLMPYQLVANHFKYKLSTTEQFNNFIFELLVAKDVRHRYKAYDVEALFFDPATDRGGPDIVLRRGADETNIYCKARSPLSALDVSFDVLQYVFGCFYHLVQDSGRSYKLGIDLKGKFTVADADGLLDQLRSAFASRSEVLKEPKDSPYRAELFRLNIPTDGLSLAQINSLLARDTGDLWVEIGGFNPSGQAKATRVAVCSVSANEHKTFEDHVIEIVRQTATAAKGRSPLVVAIHFHRYVGWEDYLGKLTSRVKLRQGVEGILGQHPNIRDVRVFSNGQEYVTLPSDAQRAGTQQVEISNRYFVEKPKSRLYVRGDAFSYRLEKKEAEE